MNKKYDVLWNIEQLGPVDEYKKEIYNDTIYYQKKFGFEKSADPTHATWNNEADAFKHGYMQAWGTFVNGELFAKLGGQLHERNGNLYMGQPTNEENMDLWNNEVGLRIGKKLKREIKNYKSFYTERQIKDMVAAKVYEYIKRGMFITDPKDTRKYYELMQLSSDQKSKDLDKIEKQQEKFDLQISKEKYLKNKERNSEKRLFSELKR